MMSDTPLTDRLLGLVEDYYILHGSKPHSLRLSEKQVRQLAKEHGMKYDEKNIQQFRGILLRIDK